MDRPVDGEAPRDVALISVSIDLGAGRRGVDMGPSALRIADIAGRVESAGRNVREAGSVTAGGFETTDAGDASLRFADEVARVAARTRFLVARALERGQMPLALGGDHSLSIGSVGGAADHFRERRKRIGVLWVDAHADMNRPETTPSGNIHGMSLAILMGKGPRRLAGPFPAVAPANVCVLAARELDPGERRLIGELGVRVFTMSEIDARGAAPCVDEALERVCDGTAGFHFSLDLDALDPRFAPGVGTPVPGGLTNREAHLVCEKAARAGLMTSMDVVELNPVLDHRNDTAVLAADLVASAMGKTIL